MYESKESRIMGGGIGMNAGMMAQSQAVFANCTPQMVKSKPEMEEYLDRLHSVIDRAEGLAQQVLERTERVLRPAVPTPTGTNGTDCVGPSTLYGQQVQHAIIRVAGVSERLQDMLDRLEA